METTWHESRAALQGENLTASVPFTGCGANEIAGSGSAVYVYAALASLSTSQEQNGYISFVLDDEPVGTYAHADSPLSDYNIPVYVNLSIPSGSHTLRVQNGAQWSASSFMILDSIVYTTESIDDDVTSASTSTSSPSPSASAIPPSTPHRSVVMGASIGVLLGLTFLGAITGVIMGVRWWRKRRRLAPSQQFVDKWNYESPLPTPRPDVESQSWPNDDPVSPKTPCSLMESEHSGLPINSAEADTVGYHFDQPSRPPRAYYGGTIKSFMSRGRRSMKPVSVNTHSDTAPYDAPITGGRRFRVVNR
ncbi:hypothetical protein HWV62_38620 [Athelia sp. TMB]|nr:hypothetical protein HWV62_38620 [Athelia sp. TMB]